VFFKLIKVHLLVGELYKKFTLTSHSIVCNNYVI